MSCPHHYLPFLVRQTVEVEHLSVYLSIGGGYLGRELLALCYAGVEELLPFVLLHQRDANLLYHLRMFTIPWRLLQEQDDVYDMAFLVTTNCGFLRPKASFSRSMSAFLSKKFMPIINYLRQR